MLESLPFVAQREILTSNLQYFHFLCANCAKKMWPQKYSCFLLSFILVSLFNTPAFAIKRSYVVYLGPHAHGADATDAELDQVTDSHHGLLGSFLGSKEKAMDAIFYSYKRHINGFAAMLEEDEAAEIANHPQVVSVFLDKAKELHTTHSWNFMLVEKNDAIHPSSIWERASYGDNTIIANLDTGVWPGAQSFSDEGYGPIPSKWKGICQNSTSKGVHCNRKLIGLRYFYKGFASSNQSVDHFMQTPLDYEGHGSHTLSTAGGNFVAGASFLGVANGTAKGGSPRARVAAYKVCWQPKNGTGGCFDSDILAAFDMAIHDGVDVISFSVGGLPAYYFEDSMSIGAFHAVKNGVSVVCSAGNSGPYPGSVTNVSPWMITVGASTLDRAFQNFVELRNGKRLKGTSLSKALPEDSFYPLITGLQAKLHNATSSDALLCKVGTLDPEKATGKIVVCQRGQTSRLSKGLAALLAGAAGMILCNEEATGDELYPDAHVLPATQLTYRDGLVLFDYVYNTRNPLGYITAPEAKIGIKPAPTMAVFSSQGPNLVTPEILKPDITAPGVNILAAFTPLADLNDYVDFDHRKFPFAFMSGTSMSCPHVSGLAGLLKTMHPHWSPAAIRSAIMTSARTRDNTMHPLLNGSYVEANPFNYGHGHIRPDRAMDPGLVYDVTTNDYLDFLCAQGYNQTLLRLFTDADYQCPPFASVLNFNNPSVTVTNLTGLVTVTRKLKNVGRPGIYTARVIQPHGISVSVEPRVLKFDRVGEEKSFKVTLEPKKHGISLTDYAFGGINWSDGYHYVRSPVIVFTSHDW